MIVLSTILSFSPCITQARFIPFPPLYTLSLSCSGVQLIDDGYGEAVSEDGQGYAIRPCGDSLAGNVSVLLLPASQGILGKATREEIILMPICEYATTVVHYSVVEAVLDGESLWLFMIGGRARYPWRIAGCGSRRQELERQDGGGAHGDRLHFAVQSFSLLSEANPVQLLFVVSRQPTTRVSHCFVCTGFANIEL